MAGFCTDGCHSVGQGAIQIVIQRFHACAQRKAVRVVGIDSQNSVCVFLGFFVIAPEQINLPHARQ